METVYFIGLNLRAVIAHYHFAVELMGPTEQAPAVGLHVDLTFAQEERKAQSAHRADAGIRAFRLLKDGGGVRVIFAEEHCSAGADLGEKAEEVGQRQRRRRVREI